jgi:peptidoglycan/LPS O-acetylase OafA/YrhL
MMDQRRSQPPESIQDAAVIGVVIAGVIASFTIPGPFDWGSTLIGLILLMVLLAYGAVPTELTFADFRRAIGMAAAAAFCLVQTFGRPLDYVVRTGVNPYRRLSHWPVPSIKRDDEKPDPNGGLELLLLWSLSFVALIAAWLLFTLLKKPQKGETTDP